MLVYLLPLIFSALFFSQIFEKGLRRLLEERDRDKIVRMVGYKGFMGIFDVLWPRKQSS